MVLAWYIITELGSILENAVKMGGNVPSWLVKLLKASANIVEAAGDLTAEQDTEGKKLNEQMSPLPGSREGDSRYSLCQFSFQFLISVQRNVFRVGRKYTK